MVLKLLRSKVVDLPTNISLSYFWGGGFMISGVLVFQMVSGIILSFYYVAHGDYSFFCVSSASSEGVMFWFVRYMHIWGVSLIFMLLFYHMGRSLYYSSYKLVSVWKVGFILYLLMMIEAFLGYMLPWHQMSYWAATVLTGILVSVPFVGVTLFQYIMGSFSVSESMLQRSFSVHVVLPFMIAGLSILHLAYLHESGSNNPLYMHKGYSDVVMFHKLFSLKDLFLIGLVGFFASFMVFYTPDFFLDAECFMEANPLVTPLSIKPEWYFLAFYAMLRSIESKVGGLLFVLGVLFLLWMPSVKESSAYSVGRQFSFWFLVCVFILLSFFGACHPFHPFLLVSKFLGLFLFFLLFIFKFFWLVPRTSDSLDLVSYFRRLS